jgi:hypothetical protein
MAKHKPIVIPASKVRNPLALQASMRHAARFQDKRRKIQEKDHRKGGW